MKIFDANISQDCIDALRAVVGDTLHFFAANERISESFGIRNFFQTDDEYQLFRYAISNVKDVVSEQDRYEYGDFQTSLPLASAVVSYLFNSLGKSPELLVEPTCGKGSFILASLSIFKSLKHIVGVEIYEPYVWETKFNIISHFLQFPVSDKPEIEIFHCNVFDFDFDVISKNLSGEVLIVGNPPWVTNSKLSVLDSDNLPRKSNFKRYNGFDAITGKGNFDIGEYVTLMMFDAFQNHMGCFAFLVKNSVIKNIIFDQYERNYRISSIKKMNIDASKEFGVSVEASLLCCVLNSNPQYTCQEYNFYNNHNPIREFGWLRNKFVSNIDTYKDFQDVDGESPFEWRQGIKHDLSSIMELEIKDNYLVNGKGEVLNLESGLLYGMLKSSDLKYMVVNQPRKMTIVTQSAVGQDTSYIAWEFPLTHNYLTKYKLLFQARKSSIYKNRPDFSIFGVGDYSFTPYKVAISGLYKSNSFTLVLPYNGKPLMLDDTCYLIGFTNLEYATYTTILLNSERAGKFLQTITFPDAKRTYTKDVLMRIDLYRLSEYYTKDYIEARIAELFKGHDMKVSVKMWDSFREEIKPKPVFRQASLF